MHPSTVTTSPLGQVDPVVVVALHGAHRGVVGERGEHGAVGDVAGVDDEIGDGQLGGDAIGQPRRRAGTEVGVGHEQHVGHRASVQR